MNNIKDNIECVKQRVKIAAQKAYRNPEDILILAVTKTVAIDKIKLAIECGLKDLGENKAQELIQKYDQIDQSCNWHFIGHLQSNKIKYIIDKVKLIHSVDSQKLALEIDRQAKKLGTVVNILIEVNISDEASKFGIKCTELYELIENLSKLSNIRVKGLMTVAPATDNPEGNRKYFKKLYKLFIDIRSKKFDNIDMKYLSMGMTNDYEIAIEEGANIVRVGTGIFGERNYLNIGGNSNE